MTNLKLQIKQGWVGAGKVCTQLGESQEINGQSWTPVLFDGADDPDWHKTASLEPMEKKLRLISFSCKEEGTYETMVYKLVLSRQASDEEFGVIRESIENVLSK